MRAHVFLCALAYMLLSLLRHHLRDTDFTPDKALDELFTLYKFHLRDSQKRFRYSERSASDGSILDARQAGSNIAQKAVPPKSALAKRNVPGSVAFTSKSRVESVLLTI